MELWRTAPAGERSDAGDDVLRFGRKPPAFYAEHQPGASGSGNAGPGERAPSLPSVRDDQYVQMGWQLALQLVAIQAAAAVQPWLLVPRVIHLFALDR